MPGFFYRTKSQLNGAPIIIACVETTSVANTQTGSMAQIYILPDVGPGITAQQAWDDGESYAAVCGDCKHRTHNTCYVLRFRGSSSVLAAVYRGKSYKEVSPDNFALRLGNFDEVRFGADGDPAAIPEEHFQWMTFFANKRTGYTHQWKHAKFEYLKATVMASCDTVDEYYQARQAGWRPFRIRTKDEPLLDGEYVCPASAEAGHRLKCQTCLTCDGADPDRPRAASPAIIVHASQKKFGLLRLQLANT